MVSGQPGGLSSGAGAKLMLAAAGCPAAYFILQRPLVPLYGALTCTAYTLLAGALLLAPRLPETLGGLAAPRAATATIWSVAALGVLPAALRYAAWAYALGHFGAARAANFLYLVPPVATGLLSLWRAKSIRGHLPRARFRPNQIRPSSNAPPKRKTRRVIDSACPCWLMKTFNCPIMTVSHDERAASPLLSSSSLPSSQAAPGSSHRCGREAPPTQSAQLAARSMAPA